MKRKNLLSQLKLKYLRFRFKRKDLFLKFLKSVLIFIFYILLFVSIVTAAAFIYFAKDLPNPQKISQRQLIQSTKIYDRTGQILLYELHGEEKRTVIPFEEIPQSVKEATIAIEDNNFYRHHGIEPKAILRALWANLRRKKIVQGGSTITQQFIKNSLLTPERTFTRKIKEIILALELELKYSKDEILEFYLNQIPYGSNVYGIEAAAQTFFGKNAKDLTLAESALLTALTKAPTYYSPYGSHPEELKKRQEYVLDRMVELNYISRQKAEEAKKEELKFNKIQSGIKAPHFVMFVREYLEEKYGQNFIEQAGLKVYTTLDWDLQQAAEKIISEISQKNEKKFRAYNAALVAIDPQTGQILTMVGSKDYFGDSYPPGCLSGKNCLFDPNVNVATRLRQPGSSFKPFAYATAFKKGYTPETIIFDLETEFTPEPALSAGSKSYKPQNYDRKFRGPVTMRQALAQSLNVPSVKVLYLAGLEPTIKLAQDMGITTLKKDQYFGLSLVLGGGEVKLLDETAAYGVFAAEGIKHPKTYILKIENSQGDILEEFEDKPIRILEPQIARLINNVLSDNQARTPIFGSSSALYLAERPVAAKTGTTQEYRDAWTIGYTPELVVGVWVGNNDNTPMIKGSGLSVAAPIWNKFMKKAYEIKTKEKENENEFILTKKIKPFIEPVAITVDKCMLNNSFEDEKIVKIDKISGKLATELTPPELIEEKIYKQVHSILYYVNKNNPLGPPPQDPELDPQFKNWETPVLEWAKNYSCQTTDCPIYNQPLPTEYDDIHTQENQPKIEIISPQKNSIINQPTVKIQISCSAPLGIKQADFFLNDDFIGTSNQPPYSFEFTIPSTLNKGEQKIKVRVYDNALNRQEKEVSVFIF